MSSPKRRRVATTAADPSPSDEQLQHAHTVLATAAHQDAELVRSQLILEAATGRTQRQQIAWSRHNLIAHASSSSPLSSIASAASATTLPATASSTLRRPHVLLRSLAQTSKVSSVAAGLAPCRLYPPADPVSAAQLFANNAAAGGDPLASAPAPAPTEYADPECITFSPCGYYLTAYFPLASTEAGAASSAGQYLSQEEHALQQIEQAGGSLAAGPPSLPSLSRVPTTAAGADAAGPMASALSAGLLPPPSASPPRTTQPKAKLCIWSRSELGALNGWKLIQVIEVSEGRLSDGSKASRAQRGNVEGQKELAEAYGGSLDASHGLPLQLHGGVQHIAWLGSKRKWVVAPAADAAENRPGPSYRRAASRGPGFLNAEEASGPQQDLALVAIGKRGQITLLHSCEVDRAAGAVAREMPFFQVLHSSLYSPALRPVPPTISNDVTGAPATPGQGSATPTGGTEQVQVGGPLSHIAIGMAADDAVLMVACKAAETTESSVHLCEVTIDLKGDSVSMVTRPLGQLPLVSNWTSNEGVVDVAEAGIGGDATLTALSWLEVDARVKSETTKEAPNEQSPRDDDHVSLRLAASFALSQSPDGPPHATSIKVWDLVKGADDLSEAFGQLECRKAGQQSQLIDWTFLPAQSKRLDGLVLTSMLAPSQLTASQPDVAIASALVLGEVHEGRTESLLYLDAKTLEVVSPTSMDQPLAIPNKALDRDSSLCLSPNGTLAAAFARDSQSGSKKKLVIWKATRSGLAGQIGSDNDDAVEAGRLLGLSMLRRTDPLDLARAMLGARTPDFLTLVVLKTAEELGMIRPGQSAAQGQKVKVEGGDAATQVAEARKTMPSFLQILRLLELQLSVEPATSESLSAVGASGECKRLILSLSMLHELLRQSRVVSPTPDGAPGAARIHYRLSSVWSLIAHLQWALTVLDSLGLQAYPSIKVTPLVELLTYRTPRLLLVQVLKGLCEFKAWLLSTTHKANLPPLQETDRTEPGFNVGAMAISEQMELARDAVRHACVEGSFDIEDAVRVLSSLSTESVGTDAEAENRWYLPTPASTSSSPRAEKAETLLRSLVDAENGALVDCLTLFLRPSDLVDEKTALRPEAGREKEVRDVVTKAVLRGDGAAGGEGTRKCVRCGALSAFKQGGEERWKNRCLCGGSWWIVSLAHGGGDGSGVVSF